MSKRTLTVSLLTAGLTAGILAAAVGPAAAQGNPVGGAGNVYYLSGAGSTGGNAQEILAFGDPGDEVFYGDWDNDGFDTPMVRRNGVFYVANKDGKTVDVFAYGNPDDRVIVGDWDGKNGDSLAVVRQNAFLVKNDVKTTGKEDSRFVYGDPGDDVLVGDWDGDGKDTLMVHRPDTSFHVKNDTNTGVADYSFFYGNPGDKVIVGDWADPSTYTDGNGADQIAVRRDGNHYFLSNELVKGKDITALRDVYYGEPTDTVFVASLPTKLGEAGYKVATADIPATYAKGDPILGKNASGQIVQEVDGFGVGKTYAGGEKKQYFAGDPKVYRGTEPVVRADGTKEVYVKDTDENLAKGEIGLPTDGLETRYEQGDYVLNEDGSLLRKKQADGSYALVTWDTADSPTTKALPDDNTFKVAVGDPVLHKRGDAVVHLEGEPAVYEVNGAFAANVPTDTNVPADFALDANNDTIPVSGGWQMAKLTTNAAGFAPGTPATYRKGERRYGYEYVPAAAARTVAATLTGTSPTTSNINISAQATAAGISTATITAPLGSFSQADVGREITVTAGSVTTAGAVGGTTTISRVIGSNEVEIKSTTGPHTNGGLASVIFPQRTANWADNVNSPRAISDDEAANWYLSRPATNVPPTADHKKVSDLDADAKSEPGVYFGTEQKKFGTTGLSVTPYQGGQAVVGTLKGEIVRDKDGNPVKLTADDMLIKGDGLGVRRNFG